MNVGVIVAVCAVCVIVPVGVTALVNGNEAVILIDAVNERKAERDS